MHWDLPRVAVSFRPQVCCVDLMQSMQWHDLFAQEKPTPDDTLSYGSHELQVIDVWQPGAENVSPAVIMIHGGCWQTAIAERDIMNWIAADLRQHGVGVWNIEYRGVDRDGGWPGTYADIGHAADLFRERSAEFGFVCEKTIVIGHSAGGHLALWLANRPALDTSEFIRGSHPVEIDLAISQGGLPDLIAAVNRDGHACGSVAPRQMLGPDQQHAQITSPPDMTPGPARQILFHNTLDQIAPPDFARAYCDRVRQKNVDVTLIETPAEGHVELVAPESHSWARQRAVILHEFGLPQ